MWKKSEEEKAAPAPAAQPRPAAREARTSLATIGPSISIQGDLSGDEDLMIQGRIDGEVRLEKNKVTIGKSGRVQADVHARSIEVEGRIKGNLYGAEDVIVRAAGRVQGNIVCGRVTLENGANFKGSIDMEPASKPGGASRPTSAAGGKDSPSPSPPDKPEPTQAKLNPAPSGS